MILKDGELTIEASDKCKSCGIKYCYLRSVLRNGVKSNLTLTLTDCEGYNEKLRS